MMLTEDDEDPTPRLKDVKGKGPMKNFLVIYNAGLAISVLHCLLLNEMFETFFHTPSKTRKLATPTPSIGPHPGHPTPLREDPQEHIVEEDEASVTLEPEMEGQQALTLAIPQWPIGFFDTCHKVEPQPDRKKVPSTTQDIEYLIGYPWHANSCWLDSSLEALFWTFMSNWPEVENIFKQATSDSHGFSSVYQASQARRSIVLDHTGNPVAVVSSKLKSQHKAMWFRNLMNITSKIKKSCFHHIELRHCTSDQSNLFTEEHIQLVLPCAKTSVYNLADKLYDRYTGDFEIWLKSFVGIEETALPSYDEEWQWDFPLEAQVDGLVGEGAIHVSDLIYDMTAHIFRGIHRTHHFVTRFATSLLGAGNHQAAFFYDGLVLGGCSRREGRVLDSWFSGHQPKLPVGYSGFRTLSLVADEFQQIPIAKCFWLDRSTISTLERRKAPPVEYFFSEDSTGISSIQEVSVGNLNKYPIDDSYEEAIEISSDSDT
ncbi:hypothetical protein F5146DRAFT_1004026 [Armillaria mellea]|nr:hypothetical protein F5146DRAFT_1004026 [Armillaria mellea]